MNEKPILLALCAVALLNCGRAVADETGDTVTVDPSLIAVEAATGGREFAVDELRRHIALVTGVEPQVAALGVERLPGMFLFRFGEGRIEGGNVESCAWEVTDEGVVFTGRPEHAVAGFLEEGLGVRWPEGDFISYVPREKLVLAKGRREWTPSLRVHKIRGSRDSRKYETFAKRLRIGAHDSPSYGHAFTGLWAMHGRDRRDFFAMRKDGLRGPIDVSADALRGKAPLKYPKDTNKSLAICCSSTGLVEQIVADWQARGMPRWIDLCENDVDGENSCHCPECVSLDVPPEGPRDPGVGEEWETWHADRYVAFGNRVLEAARRHSPAVGVCYYAYNASTDPPRRERVAPGTCVAIVPTYFSDQYIDWIVGGWTNAGASMFIYRPNQYYYFNCPYIPLGCEKHFFDIMRRLAAAGVVGFDYDSPAPYPGSFQWFERYVLLHGMQYPDLPYSHWEAHYCEAYGPAAPEVREYLAYWREEVWEKRLEPVMDEIARKGRYFNFARGLLRKLGQYYTIEDYDKAGRILDRAAARDLGGPQRELLDHLRLAHDHSRLFFEAVVAKNDGRGGQAEAKALVAFRREHPDVYSLKAEKERRRGDPASIADLIDDNQ